MTRHEEEQWAAKLEQDIADLRDVLGRFPVTLEDGSVSLSKQRDRRALERVLANWEELLRSLRYADHPNKPGI